MATIDNFLTLSKVTFQLTLEEIKTSREMMAYWNDCAKAAKKLKVTVKGPMGDNVIGFDKTVRGANNLKSILSAYTVLQHKSL